MDSIIITAFATALVTFGTSMLTYRVGYRTGYKKGGLHVLGEWKHYMGLIEEARAEELGGKEK